MYQLQHKEAVNLVPRDLAVVGKVCDFAGYLKHYQQSVMKCCGPRDVAVDHSYIYYMYIYCCSPLSSRLTALACNSTRVTCLL